MTLDKMFDLSEGYDNFKEAVVSAYQLGHITDREMNILLNEVGTYVNSTVVMSSFTEDEARRLVRDKLHSLYLSIVIMPMLRGDPHSGLEYFTYKVSLIHSAADLIKSAIKRALFGQERDKVYRSITANVIMGQEQQPPDPFERDRRREE